MSSWGLWSKVSKLEQERDFSFGGTKSSLFKIIFFQNYPMYVCFLFDAELAAGDYRSRKSITAGGLQSGGTGRS